MIGNVLDKYEVLQKVGEGGMATVYRGRHTTLDRDVAIKVLHPHLSSSTRNRKRFAREARAIEHLRHDNILEIYDYSGTDCTDCYIITEFVRGETLALLMEQVGCLPSEVAAVVGLRLARALSYAHQAGILHRDLKPDNVMIRADGTVKLMDFGIARFLDESQVTMTGALVGSPAFMSPEQAREGDLDARSDLFSLGTLLFHLVTGHLPFQGSNPSLILKNIIEGNRAHVSELAPTVSASLADVIERCMQSDRDERYASATALAADLRACLDEVDFDPDSPQWSLARYIEDPGTYEQRLEEWLQETLLERGREHLEAGDHLAALRLFNRLLSMDEDNEEVMELVQGLHGESRQGGSQRTIVLFAAGLALVAAAGMYWFGELRDDAAATEPSAGARVEPSTDPSDTEAVPVAPPRSIAPVPEPTPAPEPAPEAQVAEVAPDRQPDVRSKRPQPLSARSRPASEDAPAWVEIRTSQPYAADIYENGEKIGNVRQAGPIRVEPGEHLFVLRGPGIRDHELRVAVATDETREITVDDLRPRPAEVAVDIEYPASCQVVRNGDVLGTLGELEHRITLPRPRQENIVVLDCADGVHTETFTDLTSLQAMFPYPADAP